MNQIQQQEVTQQIKSWLDRLAHNSKVKEIKLTEKVAKAWNDIVKKVYNQYCEEGVINKESDLGYRDHPLT